jgi:hypothetical protein
VPYVPEQNGVAERENHTVVELKRLVLSVSGLQKPVWAQAVVDVLSHTRKTSVTGKFLVELWNDHVMKDLDHICGKTDINIFQPTTRFSTVFLTTIFSYASFMLLNTGGNMRCV